MIFINEIAVCVLGLKITSNLKRTKREVVFILNQGELVFQSPALQLALQTCASPAELQQGTWRSLPAPRNKTTFKATSFSLRPCKPQVLYSKTFSTD